MLNNTIFDIIEEQSILKTTKTKPIVDAIKNRKKITFYYSGPRKPKKDSVKPGYRVKAEAVALGLSKKGNLVMRAYVQPPSTSKKGFGKHGWRTFMLGRMSSTEITDEIFNEKRPGYKEGPDGGLSVTYVTTDWTKQPKTKEIEKPEPKVEPTTTVKPPIEKPKPQVKPTELPQPKPEVKPEPKMSPDQEMFIEDCKLYGGLSQSECNALWHDRENNMEAVKWRKKWKKDYMIKVQNARI
jgi:hypothetical protein